MAMPALRFTPSVAALLLAVLVAGFSPATQAQSAQIACRADFAQFCKSVQPGQGRVLACLREHQDQLSPDCKASVDSAQACADKAQQLCGSGTGVDQTPDRQAMRQCLHQHRDELPANCRSELAVR